MPVAKKRLVQPLKWHGGKHYLASKIIALMPQHLHYVEPFFGGGSVLLSKDPEGTSEVVNDIHRELTNFWRVLQHPGKFRDFYRQIEVTPFSEIDWNKAWEPLGVMYEEIQAAVAFFIRARQSRQGLMRDFATLSRNRTRRGMNEQVSSWLTAIEGLPDVHARIQRVAILNNNASAVIRQQDGPRTLFYCDPPYLRTTRSVPRAYLHEMTRQQHSELLRTLRECEGNVMISGYPDRLYDEVGLPDWNRHDFTIDNKASGAKVKRRVIECVWCNF